MTEEQAKCEWCHPDKDGMYTSARFDNQNSGNSITLFYNGARATLVLKRKGQTLGRIGHDIYFCPMCGRNVRKKTEGKE